jgi:hypothetical protein
MEQLVGQTKAHNSLLFGQESVNIDEIEAFGKPVCVIDRTFIE